MGNSGPGAVKVRFGAVLSSVVALWLLLASAVSAHEVFPSIADMERDGDHLRFSVEAVLEGFVAGVDLGAVSNTNDAPEASTYDTLRALPPDDFRARFEAFWPDMAARITVRIDGAPVAADFVSLTVADEANLEVARTSTLVFEVAVPEGAETVEFGWDRAFGAIVVRQMGVEEPFDGYLEGGDVTGAIALAGGNQAGAWETFAGYIPVGFDHIVPKGLDHILFVLGLFFLSTQFRPLLWQVTTFTLAHTITLALAALGYVSVPGSIVEPLIAASIVYVAVENMFTRRLNPWRPLIIFAFGLLHGLGFASVLAEFGLPDSAFVPALIGFNVGVEVGQLFVIALAFLLVVMAVRVDRGAAATGPATAVYGALTLALAGAALAVWQAPQVFGGWALLDGEVPLWVFLGPAAALSFLCLLSVRMVDQIDAYRRIVSVPASLGIAVVATWWVIERVFL